MGDVSKLADNTFNGAFNESVDWSPLEEILEKKKALFDAVYPDRSALAPAPASGGEKVYHIRLDNANGTAENVMLYVKGFFKTNAPKFRATLWCCNNQDWFHYYKHNGKKHRIRGGGTSPVAAYEVLAGKFLMKNN